jgi:hypothetical protein
MLCHVTKRRKSIKEQRCLICRKTDLPIENGNKEDDNDSDDEFEAPNLNLFFELVKDGNVSSPENLMATQITQSKTAAETPHSSSPATQSPCRCAILARKKCQPRYM